MLKGDTIEIDISNVYISNWDGEEADFEFEWSCPSKLKTLCPNKNTKELLLSSSQLDELKVETFEDIKLEVTVSTKEPMGSVPQFETFELSF